MRERGKAHGARGENSKKLGRGNKETKEAGAKSLDYDNKLAMENRLQRSLRGEAGVVTVAPVSLKTKSFGLQGGVSRLVVEEVGELGLARQESSPSL